MGPIQLPPPRSSVCAQVCHSRLGKEPPKSQENEGAPSKEFQLGSRTSRRAPWDLLELNGWMDGAGWMWINNGHISTTTAAVGSGSGSGSGVVVVPDVRANELRAPEDGPGLGVRGRAHRLVVHRDDTIPGFDPPVPVDGPALRDGCDQDSIDAAVHDFHVDPERVPPFLDPDGPLESRGKGELKVHGPEAAGGGSRGGAQEPLHGHGDEERVGLLRFRGGRGVVRLVIAGVQEGRRLRLGERRRHFHLRGRRKKKERQGH